MPNPIKIIVDCTCDITDELKKRYDVAMTSMPIFLGDDMFEDGVNITPAELFAYVETTGKLPRTVAINSAQYADFWKKWLNEGYDILHFTIGAGFSVCYNAAVIAAGDYPGRVFPIDTKHLSSAMALLVIKAGDLAKQGESAENIAALVSGMTGKVKSSFVLDTIEYLWKGGRCSGVAAFGANLLKIRPCIETIDGKMIPGKKYRGKTEDILMSYVESKLKDKTGLHLDHIFVTHTYQDGAIVEMVRKKVLELQPFKEVHATHAGCTICTHCGPGTLGILFVED